MSRDLYDCDAGDLATRSVESLDPDEKVGEVSEWLEEQGFDVAPVVEDQTVVGYVEAESLPKDLPEDPVRAHTNPVTIEEIISSDASFEETLSALYDAPFYFLGGRNQLTGILTRADVNHSPARIHLFDRITLLEERFRALIRDVVPKWKDEVPISPGVVDDIEERHDQAQRSNIDLEEIHYAQFSTLVTIVAEVDECWKACGFNRGHRASSQLDDLTQLRNDVAHSNQIVQNTEGGLGGGRTIGIVEQTYSTLTSCLDSLAEYA